ncbi:MAG TPA: SPOR domain-containing protein [Bacteroidales bacterium]|nr:SPOR domain-containing protein [Bacteroidales bacterium]
MKPFLFALLISLACCVQVVSAQEQQPVKGKITVYQDERLPLLTQRYKEVNNRDPFFDGFRIQIFFDSGNNSKSKATSALADFQEKHPDIKAYVSFKQPYYRIRIGNFRTKSEAIGFQKKIQADYPNAFIVKDRIAFSEMD